MTRILIVEDDPEILDIVAMKLEITGFDVLRATDGAAGLQTALAELPDLVVLDISMPRMNGIDVCKNLRANEETQNTPIILLSARGQEADVERGFAAGASDYMVKPVSLRELVSRVNRYVTA